MFSYLVYLLYQFQCIIAHVNVLLLVILLAQYKLCNAKGNLHHHHHHNRDYHHDLGQQLNPGEVVISLMFQEMRS